MYSALDISKWFLSKNNQKRIENEQDEYGVYDGITHLKLQKLLFYAQGIYVALYKTSLFSEQILAWTHGPVVQEVYDEYKKYGKSPISYEMHENDIDILDKIECDAAAKTALELTYENFSIYTAWQLREMTHKTGSPWNITEQEKGLDSVIDLGLIREYFESEIIENA